jgi:hypothetical protein
VAKKKSNLKDILAKAKASKRVAELRGVVANADIKELRIAVLASTLELLGVSAELIMAIDDKETAGAYLLRVAYLGGVQAKVGFNLGDLVDILNSPIEGEEGDRDV